MWTYFSSLSSCLIGELGHRLLVLLVQLLDGLFVVLLGLDVLLGAAGDHGLVIGAVVGLEVALGLGDELGDLGLVLGLDLLGRGELLFELGGSLLLLLGRVDAVALEVLKAVLDVQDLVGAVHAQGVYLFLYGAHMLVDRSEPAEPPAQPSGSLIFLLPYVLLLPYRYFALSLKSSS